MLRSLITRIGRVASTSAAHGSAAPAGGAAAAGGNHAAKSGGHHDHHHDVGFFQNPHPHHYVETTEEVPDALYGAFGTIEKPVIVKSAFAERIVGCMGRTNDDGHILLWHNVNNKKPTICVECGQVFQLKTVGVEHHDDGHEHKAH